VDIGGCRGWRRCVSARNVEIIIGINRRRRKMKIKCESCSKWFEAERITAKYCSEKCKKQAQRVSGTGGEVSGTSQVSVLGVSGTNSLAGQVSVPEKVSGTDVTDKLTEEEAVMVALETSGKKAAKRKQDALLATDLPEVSLDTPCNTGLSPEVPGEMFLDVEKDLGLSLKKDLGCYSWSRDGIMIRPDITVQQVHNIARLIHARHGRPCPPFREATSV
jgi:hypothetical protein